MTARQPSVPTADVPGRSTTTSRFSLTGRHVLVTGGGRGLGRAVAIAAAASGAAVTVISRTRTELDQTKAQIEDAGGRCDTYPADLADIAALPAIVGDISARAPIDGVVHAAGVQVRKPAIEVDPEDWEFVLRLNAQSPFFLSTAIAKNQIIHGRRGSHVFIGSLNSTIGLPRIAPYVASKTALLGISRALSTEWARYNIRVNIIGPGYFATKLTEDLLANENEAQRVLARIPMGRLGDARNIGDAAVFLLADASEYMSGQLINVDGGWLAS